MIQKIVKLKTIMSIALSDRAIRKMGNTPLEADRTMRYLLNLDEIPGEKNQLAKEAVAQKAFLCAKGEKERKKFDELIEIAKEKGLDFVLNACRAHSEEIIEEKEVKFPFKINSSDAFEIL